MVNLVSTTLLLDAVVSSRSCAVMCVVGNNTLLLDDFVRYQVSLSGTLADPSIIVRGQTILALREQCILGITASSPGACTLVVVMS